MTRKRWIILGIVPFVAVAIAVPIALAGQIADRLMCDRGSARSTLEGPVKQEWATRYHCRGNSYSEANALAIDQQGNIYVTGRGDCDGNPRYGDGYDYLTIKYNSKGKKLWAARYDGGIRGDDVSTAIAVDTLNNVYVTGWSMSIERDHDELATLKYDSHGNQLWVARRSLGPQGYGAEAALDIDKRGNIYVTAQARAILYTAKYNGSDGIEIWVSTHESDDVSLRNPSMATDDRGNVYAGSASSVVKYDAEGNELWRRTIKGNLSRGHCVMALDLLGNVYGMSADYLAKYDADGTEIWVQPIGVVGHPTAAAIDELGNIYALGSMRVIKCTSDGVKLWDAPGGEDMVLDNSGNVYVTGLSEYEGDSRFPEWHYATAKYSPEGEQIWYARYRRGIGPDRATAVALDASGNVYVTGYTTVKRCESWFGEVTEYKDFLTIKYSQ